MSLPSARPLNSVPALLERIKDLEGENKRLSDERRVLQYCLKGPSPYPDSKLFLLHRTAWHITEDELSGVRFKCTFCTSDLVKGRDEDGQAVVRSFGHAFEQSYCLECRNAILDGRMTERMLNVIQLRNDRVSRGLLYAD